VTSPRTQLRDALKAGVPAAGDLPAVPGLPDRWRLIDYPTADVGAVNAPTVMVWQQQIARVTSGDGWGTCQLEAFVIVSQDGQPSKTEDALEAALNLVLDITDRLLWLNVTTVERADYQGKFPSYHLTATAAVRR
jgi:hypothetical protein